MERSMFLPWPWHRDQAAMAMYASKVDQDMASYDSSRAGSYRRFGFVFDQSDASHTKQDLQVHVRHKKTVRRGCMDRVFGRLDTIA